MAFSEGNVLAGTDPERELDALLSESPEAAQARATEHAAWYDPGRHQLLLYGAGTIGRSVLAGLRRSGIEPAGFADDTPGKQGQTVDGAHVMRPQDAIEAFGESCVFVVTILNPMLSHLRAKERLEKLGAARVVSFLDLMWAFPNAFLPYCQFELPQIVLPKAAAIRAAFNLLSDEDSRRQFVAHLRFRLQLDHKALPANEGESYFPAGLVPRLPDDCVFVDCGAFDGDTIGQFLRHQDHRFGEIHAFEPDASNCLRLRKYVAGLTAEEASRIHVHQAGVGERKARLKFNSSGNMAAALDEDGSIEVDVLPIGDVVKETGGLIYLKFDVEGAEDGALRGAEELIRRSRPLLAISVYHRPDDLWHLPLYVHSLCPDYRLYLRTQGDDGMDAICYAIPPDMPPGSSHGPVSQAMIVDVVESAA